MGLFSNLLPRRKKPLSEWEPRRDQAALKKRVRIVVIDDDQQAFPIEGLRAEGYAIDYWPRVESLDRLERGDYDIIVLDIGGVASHLAEGDGLSVLQHLKARNPIQVVVAFSGQSFDLGKQQFFRLADDSLNKPATLLACKQAIDHLIETKLTVPQIWAEVETLLRREGVSSAGIKTLDQEVHRALQGKGTDGAKKAISRILSKAEVVARVALLVERLVTLFGR